MSWMNHTIGPSVLFPLDLLAVLVQLLVCQLVEGVGRFWPWWDFRWADWRLIDEQRHKITAFNTAVKEEDLERNRDRCLASGESAVYRRTVDCYNAGEDLRLWSCCLHVLTILLSDLRRVNKTLVKHFWFMWRRAEGKEGELWETKKAKRREKLPCFVSQSPLEGWWKEAQTGLWSLSWWLCCQLVSPLLPSTTKGKTTNIKQWSHNPL